MRLLYADKWLKAKRDVYEQHVPHMHISIIQLNNEKRIHKEIARIYEIAIKEKEDAVEYWHKRFANDITYMKKNIAVKREDLQNTITKCGELQQLFNLHAGEMNAWLTFKRERAARRAREERARISATLIQAWWRGVMVRRALGAFRYLRHRKPQTKVKKKN
ncbi:hypothetical protein EVAR_15665_1 [Eumeta japonica]|uniref:Dynein regulatory complex protein 9 n=1 Tax=Eumeta variegata TaxID=151549 RepID=A0A4C1U9F4_EUMVA|nr:hypothetical protein EVAR_15665_1 [Eumeta japonica]